jgi:hypothetical protein
MSKVRLGQDTAVVIYMTISDSGSFRAVRVYAIALPPAGKRQVYSLPARTVYFLVKTKCSSIFVRTSRMWVKYWRKPPL